MVAGIGYIVSAVGYALLLLLILTVRKSGLAKYLLWSESGLLLVVYWSDIVVQNVVNAE